MQWHFYINIFLTLLSSILLLFVCIYLFKINRIFLWRKYLKKELQNLKQFSTNSSLATKDSVKIIENKCYQVLESLAPQISDLQTLPNYIRSIAACYDKKSKHPEFQITVAHLLISLEKSLDRFDLILKQPGVKRLKSVNIRQINQVRQSYIKLSRYRLFKWYMQNKKKIQQLLAFRIIFFPDPFTWVIYFSNRLSIVTLSKYLMVDLYLFFGKLAIEAYSKQDIDLSEDNLEESYIDIEEFDRLQNIGDASVDPRILMLRRKLLGTSLKVTSMPTFSKLKSSVNDAAFIISKKYFPQSNAPLEEAEIGSLLDMLRSWITFVENGKQSFLLKHVYKIRVDTLLRAKQLSDIIVPYPVRNVVSKTYKTYNWLKWPVNIYRLTRGASPWKIAADIGIATTRRAAFSYIYSKAFDKACNELEKVYAKSSKPAKKRVFVKTFNHKYFKLFHNFLINCFGKF